MTIDKLLTIKGIFKGNADGKYQYYQIQAESIDGKNYLMSVGCKAMHTTSCEKAFGRLVLIPAPSDEVIAEIKAANAAVPPTDKKKLN